MYWVISPELDGMEVVIGLVVVYIGGGTVEVVMGKVGWGKCCGDS